MDYGHINSPRDNFDGIFDGPIVGNPEETVDAASSTSENSQETNIDIAGNRSLGNKAIRFNREDQGERTSSGEVRKGQSILSNLRYKESFVFILVQVCLDKVLHIDSIIVGQNVVYYIFTY